MAEISDDAGCYCYACNAIREALRTGFYAAALSAGIDRTTNAPVDPYCPDHGDRPTTYDTCSCDRRKESA